VNCHVRFDELFVEDQYALTPGFAAPVLATATLIQAEVDVMFVAPPLLLTDKAALHSTASNAPIASIHRCFI
jgi:hypothetical protein